MARFVPAPPRRAAPRSRPPRSHPPLCPEENAGVIRLAEMLKKREEADNKEADDESAAEQPSENSEVDGEDAVETVAVAEEEDDISPQLEEATNVLVDLIAFNTVSRTAVRTGGVDTR